MLNLSRVDFVRYFVKRQVPNPFHRALTTCRRQVRLERSCPASSQAEMGQRTLSAEKSAHASLCFIPVWGQSLRGSKGQFPCFSPSVLSPLLPGHEKVARRPLGAVDPIYQLVLRCSAPGNCQEFGPSRHLSHLPSLCGLLLLWKRMQSQTNSSCGRHRYSPPLHPVGRRSTRLSLGGQPARTSSLLCCLWSRRTAEHVEERAQGKGCWCGSQQCPFEAVFCGCIRIRTCQITCARKTSVGDELCWGVAPLVSIPQLFFWEEKKKGILHHGSFIALASGAPVSISAEFGHQPPSLPGPQLLFFP